MWQTLVYVFYSSNNIILQATHKIGGSINTLTLQMRKGGRGIKYLLKITQLAGDSDRSQPQEVCFQDWFQPLVNIPSQTYFLLKNNVPML